MFFADILFVLLAARCLSAVQSQAVDNAATRSASPSPSSAPVSVSASAAAIDVEPPSRRVNHIELTSNKKHHHKHHGHHRSHGKHRGHGHHGNGSTMATVLTTTVLRQNDGFIESPVAWSSGTCSVPVNYTWLIEVAPGREIVLSFTDMSILGATDLDDALCARTPSVRLYDGADIDSPNIASLCATRRHSDGHFRSSGNHLLVVGTMTCQRGSGWIEFRAEFHAVNTLAELATDEGECPCGRSTVESNVFAKIVGGSEAAAHAWPWQASIRYKDEDSYLAYLGIPLSTTWTHICGGSIIGSRWIITAAHCVTMLSLKASNYRVVVGGHRLSVSESTERSFNVEQIFVHENYTSVPHNDIALLRLTDDVTFNDHIRPICLPQDVATVDMFCVATGWGTKSAPTFSDWLFGSSSSPDELRQVRLPIQPVEVCRSTLDALDASAEMVNDGILCAGYMNVAMDTCKGDSGGPLACLTRHRSPQDVANGNATTAEHQRWTLYGLTSAGKGCANYLEYPGSLYTRVDRYEPWIRRTMAGNSVTNDDGKTRDQSTAGLEDATTSRR